MPTSQPHGQTRVDPVPPSVREQAIGWYVRLASGMQTPEDEAAFERWHQAHPDHARAWRQLQEMGGRLRHGAELLTPRIAHGTLQKAANAGGRRRALKAIACLGAGGTALYLLQAQTAWQSPLAGMLADVRSATGEHRHITLEDGTHVALNTASAIDVCFDARQRRIVLHAGEIMVTTGTDSLRRPLVVVTAEGTLTPIGTTFSVRHEAETGLRAYTRIGVTAGAVEVRLHSQQALAPVLVRAGQQLNFMRDAVMPLLPLDPNSLAWVDGTFVAAGMRLDDFLTELGHYRLGVVRWAPEVAHLRITGTWPLRAGNATDLMLDSLERRLPVTVTRTTRYWVTVTSL
jgi:transmembrane sensor